MVDIATGQVPDAVEDGKDVQATSRGRAGGRSRAANLTAAHSVAIHTLYYNFLRIHQTLRCTPAMAAKVTTTLWELADMVKVLEDWEGQT